MVGTEGEGEGRASEKGARVRVAMGLRVARGGGQEARRRGGEEARRRGGEEASRRAGEARGEAALPAVYTRGVRCSPPTWRARAR